MASPSRAHSHHSAQRQEGSLMAVPPKPLPASAGLHSNDNQGLPTTRVTPTVTVRGGDMIASSSRTRLPLCASPATCRCTVHRPMCGTERLTGTCSSRSAGWLRAPNGIPSWRLRVRGCVLHLAASDPELSVLAELVRSEFVLDLCHGLMGHRSIVLQYCQMG